ncbi:hypothetical protein QUF80_19415 [Desulfococcaceae bacterium HSG8]|nr:hypothetical protein [Desulfococcaceae bacterium HSG8]
MKIKGGAADYQRKLARVHFIGSILEEYGFRIEKKADYNGFWGGTFLSRRDIRE